MARPDGAAPEPTIRGIQREWPKPRPNHLPVAAAQRWVWSSRRVGRGELAAAVGLAAAVCGLFIAITAARGALGVARNDDWNYYRSAFELSQTGQFLPEWASAMLIGHLVLALPVIAIFGEALAPLQVWTAGVATVGLSASYCLARLLLPRGLAAACVAMLALGPIFGSLSTSFMTDIPAFALQVLCLLAGAAALGGGALRVRWLGAAMLLGFASFTIREYSLAAPAAVLAVLAWQGRRRGCTWLATHVLMPGLVLALACAALYSWRIGAEGWIRFTPPLSFRARVGEATAILTTLALMVAPAALAISPRRLRAVGGSSSRVRLAVLAGLVLWLGLIAGRHQTPGVVLGNYLTPWGSYPATLAGVPSLVLTPFTWIAIHVLTLICLLILMGLAAAAWVTRRDPGLRAGDSAARRSEAGLLTAYVGLSVAMLAGAGLILRAPVFDRAMLPLVVPAAALTLYWGTRQGLTWHRSGYAVAGGIFLMALIGLATVDASVTRDGAKWDLAERVAQRGYPPDSIEGGYEWFGFHQTGQMQPRRPVPEGTAWWVAFFAEGPICATVRNESQVDYPSAGAAVDEITRSSISGATFRLVARLGPDRCVPGEVAGS